MSISHKLEQDFKRFLDEYRASEQARQTKNANLAIQFGIDPSQAAVLDGNATFTVFAEDDVETIRAKRGKPPEEDIFDLAHPEPVFMAESDNEGGLVENGKESQEKMLDVVNRIPVGFAYNGVTAGLVEQFAKLANDFDARGLHAEAIELDELAEELVSRAAGEVLDTNDIIEELDPAALRYESQKKKGPAPVDTEFEPIPSAKKPSPAAVDFGSPVHAPNAPKAIDFGDLANNNGFEFVDDGDELGQDALFDAETSAAEREAAGAAAKARGLGGKAVGEGAESAAKSVAKGVGEAAAGEALANAVTQKKPGMIGRRQ